MRGAARHQTNHGLSLELSSGAISDFISRPGAEVRLAVPLLSEVPTGELSLYLSQHVTNPVAWHAWSTDAFEKAQELQRPIFLSIGYAACHWCHVMAHESFEDVATAQLLNDNFICIKVDREERPDVDSYYMAATQLVSGHGGWPMSVFLLPDGRPFLAGTYYPPQDRHGQVGFPRLLHALTDAWQSQRDTIEEQAGELGRALRREVAFVDHLAPFTDGLNLVQIRTRLRQELITMADTEGGFGTAPKFPRPSYVEALLGDGDPAARSAVEITLNAMARRGLYDHIEGGFARYSVDNQWHIPHFEKMLSDQALLARCYFRASRLGPQFSEWRHVANETLRFVIRDLAVRDGFASSLDADANGIEGSHVTWTVDEINNVLTRDGRVDDVTRATRRWTIEANGRFEGRSIPQLADGEPFLTPSALETALQSLQRARSLRPQPLRDDKVILEWNAMFATACFESGDPEFVTVALELLTNLHRTHWREGAWRRTASSLNFASAADLAWLLDALVQAFEWTGDDLWLQRSELLGAFLLEHYWDGTIPSVKNPDSGRGLFVQSDHVTDLPARIKEIFDGATPSSHAVACRALARLALCNGSSDTLAVAQRLVNLAASLLQNHPVAVPDLVEAAGWAYEGIQIVVPGDANELSDHVRSLAMSYSVLITGNGTSPLLLNREAGTAYACRAGICHLPTNSIDTLEGQLREMASA